MGRLSGGWELQAGGGLDLVTPMLHICKCLYLCPEDV